MKKLLIATTNPGKLAEIRLFLSDVPVELLSLNDAGITTQVEETGKTFEENAILKAKTYAEQSGLMTLADDGGFEIDALHGEPGVRSHRWIHSDRDSTDEELIAYTFTRMAGVPEKKRGARLTLVLALVQPGSPIITTANASIRGIVPMEPSTVRHKGFPYRSILYLPELGKFYDHMSFTPEETEKYNHRKKALDKIKQVLLQIV